MAIIRNVFLPVIQKRLTFDAADVLGGIKDIGDTEQQKRMDRVNHFRTPILHYM
jgi:hypothetical protein